MAKKKTARQRVTMAEVVATLDQRIVSLEKKQERNRRRKKTYRSHYRQKNGHHN